MYEIKLDGSVEKIELKKIGNDRLQEMINMAITFENYELCSHLKKYISN